MNPDHTTSTQDNKRQLVIVAVLSVVAIFLGIGGGYLLRGSSQSVASTTNLTTDSEGQDIITDIQQGDTIVAGQVYGNPNAADFPDNTQGYLEAGGINGEGSHALLRPGGASQTVYLTSSSLDLDNFVGMDIKVWGETMKGQSAGWLMDVGRVEVVNLKGTIPE